MTIALLALCCGLSLFATAQNDSALHKKYLFQNTSLSFEKRAEDLVSQLTLEEKLALMQNNA